MQLVANVKNAFFTAEKVVLAVSKAERKALSKFGAYVRTRSKSSIRNAPKKKKVASPPGRPPLSRTGLLKRHIYFAYEARTGTVVIGPAALKPKPTVPSLLEAGGVAVTKAGKRLNYKARPYMGPAFAAELKGPANPLKTLQGSF